MQLIPFNLPSWGVRACKISSGQPWSVLQAGVVNILLIVSLSPLPPGVQRPPRTGWSSRSSECNEKRQLNWTKNIIKIDSALAWLFCLRAGAEAASILTHWTSCHCWGHVRFSQSHTGQKQAPSAHLANKDAPSKLVPPAHFYPTLFYPSSCQVQNTILQMWLQQRFVQL